MWRCERAVWDSESGGYDAYSGSNQCRPFNPPQYHPGLRDQVRKHHKLICVNDNGPFITVSYTSGFQTVSFKHDGMSPGSKGQI